MKRPRFGGAFFYARLNPGMDKRVSPLHHGRPRPWKRAARAVLATLVLVTAWMGWQASQLEFNYDFEQFFPADHPETRFTATSATSLGATTTS